DAVRDPSVRIDTGASATMAAQTANTQSRRDPLMVRIVRSPLRKNGCLGTRARDCRIGTRKKQHSSSCDTAQPVKQPGLLAAPYSQISATVREPKKLVCGTLLDRLCINVIH